MIVKYSAEWIKAEVREKKATRLMLRTCSICDAPLYYVFEPDGAVRFHFSCNCTRHYSPPRPSSFDEIENLLTIQSNDEFRDNIMRGLITDLRRDQ